MELRTFGTWSASISGIGAGALTASPDYAYLAPYLAAASGLLWVGLLVLFLYSNRKELRSGVSRLGSWYFIVPCLALAAIAIGCAAYGMGLRASRPLQTEAVQVNPQGQVSAQTADVQALQTKLADAQAQLDEARKFQRLGGQEGVDVHNRFERIRSLPRSDKDRIVSWLPELAKIVERGKLGILEVNGVMHGLHNGRGLYGNVPQFIERIEAAQSAMNESHSAIYNFVQANNYDEEVLSYIVGGGMNMLIELRDALYETKKFLAKWGEIENVNNKEDLLSPVIVVLEAKRAQLSGWLESDIVARLRNVRELTR